MDGEQLLVMLKSARSVGWNWDLKTGRDLWFGDLQTMFGIPGIGRAFVAAVVRRDYAMIMGSTLFYTLIVTVANLFVDLSYAAVDPRIRYR